VNKAAKDGRESLCKACKTEKRKEREGELLQSSYVARERLMQEEIADQQAKPDTINTSDHNLDQALEQEMWRILEKIRRRVNESDSKKSDPPPDPDDLVRVLLERCGRGDLYAVLSEVAAQQLRPVYMQAVYMLSFELIAFKDKP